MAAALAAQAEAGGPEAALKARREQEARLFEEEQRLWRQEIAHDDRTSLAVPLSRGAQQRTASASRVGARSPRPTSGAQRSSLLGPPPPRSRAHSSSGVSVSRGESDRRSRRA